MRPSGWFDPQAVARRLRVARGGLSQRELGERLGYLQPHISRYERGQVPGSFRFLAGLSAKFGVDVAWVLTGTHAAQAATRRDRPSVAVLEDLRGSIKDAVRDSFGELVRSSRSQAAAVVIPVEAAWDRLMLELPLLVNSLVKPFPGPSRVAPVSCQGAGNRELVRPDTVLLAVKQAGDATDLPAAVEAMIEASSALEDREPSPVNLERSRFLLLWASQLAASHAFPEALRPAAVARTVFHLARATRKTGRLDEAAPLYAAAQGWAAEAGEERIAARCHAGLGNVYFEKGDFESARTEYVALLKAALRLGSPDLLFRAYLDLSAYYHEHERDFARAADYAEQGLSIARQEQDREHEARFLNELGLNALEQGNLAVAEDLLREALSIAEIVDMPLLRAVAGNNLGELQLEAGALLEAEASLLAAHSCASQAGISWAELQAEILLARLEHARGHLAAALEKLNEVQEEAQSRGLMHEAHLARELEREIQGNLLTTVARAAS